MEGLLVHNGTKGQIISVLSNTFPLTARRIYGELKRQHLSPVTYHACYQHLQELLRQGVVEKEGMQYRLSGKWIENVRRFLDTTDNNYSATKLNGARIECVRLMSFRSQSDFHCFVEDMRKNFSGNEIYWIGDHAWGPLFFMNSTAEGLSKAKGKGVKFYICIRGGTPLDMMVANFYRSLGIKNVICGVGECSNYMIYIYGDELILVDHPPCISRQIDLMFRRAKKMSDMDLGRLYQNIMQKEQPIQAMVIRNKEFVKRYKEQILSNFAD